MMGSPYAIVYYKVNIAKFNNNNFVFLFYVAIYEIPRWPVQWFPETIWKKNTRMAMQVIAQATKYSKNVIVERPQKYPYSYVLSQKLKGEKHNVENIPK